MHPIHMQLSQKQKTFPRIFDEFFKSTLNFEHIQKKDDTHSHCVCKIKDFQKRG